MSSPRPAPFGRAFLAQPHGALEELRQACPVAHVATPAGKQVWLVSRSEDVRAGLLDPRLSLQTSVVASPGKPRRALDVSLLNYDPPEHSRIRKISRSAFTPRRVEAHRPQIEAVATRLVEAMGASPQVDFMAAFARPFSFGVLGELFGIAESARGEVYEWVFSLFNRSRYESSTIEANIDHLEAFIRAEVSQRRREPGDDVLSSIVGSWTPDGDVTEDELISLCAMLLMGGFDSTVQMLSLCVLALVTHPDFFARVRDDLSLVPRAVDELLRWDTPALFTTRRWATEDVRIGDTVVPAGSGVLLSIAAANRDPQCHGDPNRLSLDREGATRHLTFGLGPHYCPGAGVAKLELTVALTALIRRFPRMALATPVADLRWGGNHIHRTLSELVISLGEPAR